MKESRTSNQKKQETTVAQTSNLAGSARSRHSSMTWFQSTLQSSSLSSPMMLCLEKRLKSNTCITAVESRREDLEIWAEDVRKPMFQSAFPDLDELLDQSGLATTAQRSSLTETVNIVWVWSFEDTRIYFSLQSSISLNY